MSSCHLKSCLSESSFFTSQHSGEIVGTSPWCTGCWDFLFLLFSSGNDCTQQRHRSAPSLSSKTQNYCPTSELESCPGPWRKDLLLPYCHEVGICPRLLSVHLCPEIPCSHLTLFHTGKRSGTLRPGKEVVKTLMWTMNQRWTWEHPPTMRTLTRLDLVRLIST